MNSTAGSGIKGGFKRAKIYAGSSGLGGRLIRSVSGTALARAAAMVASFGVGVLLARLLGTAGYGYYGLALAVITIAGIPGELGIPRLVTREIAAGMARHDAATVFGVLQWGDRIVLRLSVLIVVGILVAAAILVDLDRRPLGFALLAGAPIIPLLGLARVRAGALQGLHHIVRGQIPELFIRPLTFLVLLTAWWMSVGTMTAASAMALHSTAALFVLAAAHIWLKSRSPPRPVQVAQSGRRWLSSAVPMGLTDGMRVLQSELSVLLLGLVALPTQAGLFRIANVTAFAAAMPVAMINQVASPVIARLHAENDQVRLQKALTRLGQAQFAGVLLLCVPLIVAAEPLLKLVYGSDYVAAAPSLRILAAGQIISAAFGLNAALLNMTNHERRVTRAMSISLVLNFVAILMLASLWGEVGASIALAVSLILWNVLTWFDARRLLRLETLVFHVGRAIR